MKTQWVAGLGELGLKHFACELHLRDEGCFGLSGNVLGSHSFLPGC